MLWMHPASRDSLLAMHEILRTHASHQPRIASLRLRRRDLGSRGQPLLQSHPRDEPVEPPVCSTVRECVCPGRQAAAYAAWFRGACNTSNRFASNTKPNHAVVVVVYHFRLRSIPCSALQRAFLRGNDCEGLLETLVDFVLVFAFTPMAAHSGLV